MSLSRVVLMRARAATALGKTDETIALAGVVWRLSRALMAETTVGVAFSSLEIDQSWNSCVRDLIRSPALAEKTLASLLDMPGAAWSPENEIRRSWRGEAAFSLAIWRGIIADPEHDLSDIEYRGHVPTLHENFVRYGPRGWLNQNAATSLRDILEVVIRPLASGNFASLPRTLQDFETLESSNWGKYSPYRILSSSSVSIIVMRIMVHRVTRTRLTLLAIAMELYRLRHGRYPEDTAALVPDCIAAIPPDIDGAPLRIATSPDGAKSVLYSIGWNLIDDWHGAIPATYKEDDDLNSADWPLALPFSPLPPP